MRPINLIPEQERRRQGGAGRTGPLAFIVIGALVIALGGVVALVTTSNQISERESELASLNARTAAAQARADRLAPFTSFNEVKEQRTETISELADNRFDWSRVLHELSLVMPRWVILSEVSGSSGKSEGGGGGGGDTIGQSITGPSLSVIGCAKSQARVAQMIAALKQIDGVTRVGLGSSVKELTQGTEGSEGGSSCNPGAYGFDAVAAFDAAPLPVEATEASEPEATSESESSESAESGEGETASTSDGAEETTTTGSDGSTTKVKTESVPPKS
jgi:Tfp pilus assembly protein PilN